MFLIKTLKGQLVEVDPNKITLIKFLGTHWVIVERTTYEISDVTFKQLMEGWNENETDSSNDGVWPGGDTRKL